MQFKQLIRRGSVAAVLVLSPLVIFAAPQTYNVRTGDTLDQVIRQTMGSSPLKVELLRQAFNKAGSGLLDERRNWVRYP